MTPGEHIPYPRFIRSNRSPGGWAVEMPYTPENNDVVTVHADKLVWVVQLKSRIDIRGRIWSYEKIGRILRNGSFAFGCTSTVLNETGAF
jgi:hypothetical protein